MCGGAGVSENHRDDVGNGGVGGEGDCEGGAKFNLGGDGSPGRPGAEDVGRLEQLDPATASDRWQACGGE